MELLDKAVYKYGSLSAVARELKVSVQFLHKVQKGDRSLPAYQAGRIAELLDANPLETIIHVMEEQAKKKDEAKKWRDWSKLLHSFIIGAFVVGGVNGWSQNAHAGEYQTDDSHKQSIQCVAFLRGVAHQLKHWLRSQSKLKEVFRSRQRVFLPPISAYLT